MNEPFVEGAVATGTNFIGRKKLLKKLSGVMRFGNTKSISICGLPRIGKTSLICNLLNDSELKSDKVLTAFVSLAAKESFFHLWREIMGELRESLEFHNLHDNMVTSCIDAVVEACKRNKPERDYEELNEHVVLFFKAVVSKLGVDCLIAMDEFDQAARVFGDDSGMSATYFQFIRELATHHEKYGVSFIIISRSRLVRLESSVPGASVLHMAMATEPVLGFNDDDLSEYEDVLRRCCITINDNVLKNIHRLGGRSPLLLSKIGNVLYRNDDRVLDNFSATDGEISLDFSDYYKNLIELSKKDGYYNKLVQMFVGPKYDLNNADVNELKNLGYVEEQSPDENGILYRSICPDFTDYLRELMILDENDNIWPNLSQAEKRLRSIIDGALSKKYGGPIWEKAIRVDYDARKASNPSKYGYFVDFGKAEKFCNNMKRKYSGRGNPRLLNAISFQELWNIMEFYWNDGISEYFPKGDTISDWNEKLELLQRARDPLAHANPEFLNHVEIRQANIYCDEILQKTVV
jgi:hypothetical protein